MPPGERKRRHHQRSRNGCVSCKERHMRCDEGKPFCRNCLKNGAACGYLGASASKSGSPSANLTVDAMSLLSPMSSASTPTTSGSTVFQSQGFVEPFAGFNHPGIPTASSQSYIPPLSFSTILPATRSDPFDTLPLELSDESKMLLDHFGRNRILFQKNVQSQREPELFRFAASDPAMLHSAIFLAAHSWIKLGGRRTLVEPTYYQHKTEAIRMINERLGDMRAATSDGTVGAIVCLVLLEALDGAGDIAAVHLNGLKQLIDLRGDLHSGTMNRYLQRLIMVADLLTSSATQTKPRFQASPLMETKETKSLVSTSTDDNLAYFQVELGLDPDVSRMFVDLHGVSHLMEENDNGTPKVAKDILHRSIHEAEMAIDSLIHGGRYDLRTVKGVQSNSGCCVIAGCIYVYYSLRRIPIKSTLYDYMVHLLKEDIEKVAVTIRQVFPKELLFWVLFVGALAGTERPEACFLEKELAVSRQVLRITTWEVAKFILKKFAWVETWNDEIGEELFNGLKRLE